MKRFERLAEAQAPDGSVLTLFRHDRDYFVHVNGVELMSTRRSHSEDRLAEVVCAPLRTRPGAEILIGGLGLGFTLRAALRSLGPDARVRVAELIPEVIEWNRDPAYALAGQELRDARVETHCGDVLELLREGAGTYDGIILDIDNGAEPLTTARNAELYRERGIRSTIRALRPGGVIAYWSATPDRAFERTLRRAGLTVESLAVRAHARAGPVHSIILARRV